MIQSQENSGAYLIKKDKMVLSDYSEAQALSVHTREIGGIMAFHSLSRYEINNYPGGMPCAPTIRPIEHAPILGSIFATTPSFIIGQKDNEIKYLKQTIFQMRERLESLERNYQKSPIQIRVVEVHEKPIDEIRKLVLEYYNTHEVAYPDEVAEILKVDLRKVIEVVDQLIEEGKIEVAT